MYARLDFISARLEWLGLTHRTSYRKMLQRIAGSAAAPEELAALRRLTDVVEPVKDYTRERTAPAEPTSLTPMHRVVDAVPLESDAARHFGELVDKFVSTSCMDSDMQARLAAQFTQWRDNGKKLQPLIDRSFLVKEIEPLSQDLSLLGVWGLAALDALAHGQEVSDSTKAQQLAALEQVKKPKGQLLLIPASAVQRLIEAVSPGGTCAGAKH
jgi:hexosaminidase